MSATLQLPVSGAPLPPDFVGTPQEMFEAMLDRMLVYFPTGQSTFVTSDTEPTTNLGPWLKTGDRWYVWDEDTSRYVAINIDDSLKLIAISETAPATGEKPIWLQYKGTRVIRWNLWLGAWKPLTNRGTTAERPSDPVEYERYEDTDIATEIVFYDGAWHTVSGSPGDIKQVAWPTLAEAVQYNPGWQEIGQYFSNTNVRGRAFVAAHKDPASTPTNFSPEAGVTARVALDKYGAETHTLIAAEASAQPHQHLVGKRNSPSDNDAQFQIIASQAFVSAITGANKLHVDGSGVGDGLVGGDLADGDLVTSNAITGTPVANDAHNNLQPTMAVWTLVKL